MRFAQFQLESHSSLKMFSKDQAILVIFIFLIIMKVLTQFQVYEHLSGLVMELNGEDFRDLELYLRTNLINCHNSTNVCHTGIFFQLIVGKCLYSVINSCPQTVEHFFLPWTPNLRQTSSFKRGHFKSGDLFVVPYLVFNL